MAIAKIKDFFRSEKEIGPSIVMKLALVRAACRETDELIAEKDFQKIKTFLNSLSNAIKV